MKTTALALLASCAALPLTAQDTRELDAHVHGVSSLQVAIEDGMLSLDLTSPGMDIVGFEYVATQDADKDAVADAITTFLTPTEIVTLPAEAGCRLFAASAHLHGGDDDHDHADHDDHDHADAAAAPEDDHDHDHAEGGDHDNDDDHAEGTQHSAFHATYTFACDAPEALTTITFPFFDRFPTAQEIEAAYITDGGAGTAEITRDAARLDLTDA